MSNLYLEADEDITSAIDKMEKVDGHEVRIVVPKRSGLLSSLINLKLLKKAAHDSKKKLVLVTTDATITNLASRVDLAVAENVNAEAEVPDDKVAAKADSGEIVEEETDEPIDSKDKPADEAPGEEEGATAIDMSHRPAPSDDSDGKSAEHHKEKKTKGSRIPDFGSLQKRIMIAVIVAAAIIGLFALNFWFKKADITIFAKGTQIPSEVSFKGVTDGPADPVKGEVGAQKLTISKASTSSFPATGKKDVGAKASGSVTVTNKCFNPGTLPAGTTFTSASGLKFVSASDVAIPDSTKHAGVCNTPSTAAVSVTAAANGDNYNLAPTSYTVGGYDSSDMSGSGNQMSGGVSKTINVVSSGDVDAAKSKLATVDDSIKDELAKKATDDQIAARDTFAADAGGTSPSPAVGAEASTFTLSGSTNYTMMAFKKTDLDKLVKTDVMAKIGQGNDIYDTGLKDATITAGATPGLFDAKTTVYAGAKLDQDAIKKAVKGKKVGGVKTVVESTPGVDHADISLWPIWSSSAPRITSHIHITIKVEAQP